MFYDKGSMVEMHELSVKKNKWKRILITTEMFGEEFQMMGVKEIISMHKDWKRKVKEVIHQDDAGYIINQGNIFCLVNERNLDEFKNRLSKIIVNSRQYEGYIRSIVTPLTNEETNFLLNMS